jgi:hypothetical protein
MRRETRGFTEALGFRITAISSDYEVHNKICYRRATADALVPGVVSWGNIHASDVKHFDSGLGEPLRLGESWDVMAAVGNLASLVAGARARSTIMQNYNAWIALRRGHRKKSRR